MLSKATEVDCLSTRIHKPAQDRTPCALTLALNRIRLPAYLSALKSCISVEVESSGKADPIRSLASSALNDCSDRLALPRHREAWWGSKESVYHECAVPYAESKGHSPSLSK